MNAYKVLLGICSLMFLMIGLDKFFGFLEPPCSLQSSIPPMIWSVLGVVQIAAAILLWMPKYRKHVAGFFAVFMIVFALVHFSQSTSDIGGAAFMAVLLGVVVWNPSFLGGQKQ